MAEAADPSPARFRLRPGTRVALRYRLPAGPDPSSPSMTDVVGVVTSVRDEPPSTVVVQAPSGPVTVALDDIVAVREVPPRQTRPGPAHTTIGVGDLERVMAQAWPAVEVEPLGEWLLRASGGFTGRGNSVLADGDPGMHLAEAVDACEQWYDVRGLPARFHLDLPGGPLASPRDGSGLDAAVARLPLGSELLERGYRPTQPTRTMTGPVAAVPLLPQPSPQAADAVRVDDRLTPAWLATYARQRSLLPGVSERILTGSPRQLFLSTGRPDAPTGIVRLSMSPGWAGLHALWVDPAVRRRGLASALLSTAAALAREHRLGSLVLQVEANNTPAVALYESVGISTHHVYCYLDQPAPRD